MGKMNNLFFSHHETKDPFYASHGKRIGITAKTLDHKMIRNTQVSKRKLLVDRSNNNWYYYPIDRKGKFDLVATNDQTGTIMNKKVKGTPNIYEFENSVVIACEGNGEVGYVYQFSKDNLKLLNEWEIDGFIWGVIEYNGSVCVSAYVVDLDTARLYILNGRSVDFVELGTHFAPSDLLVLNERLFISSYPLSENSPKQILMVDEEYDIEKKFGVSICPRFLFENGEDILIQELDVKTGRSDRYSLLNLNSGEEMVSKRSMPLRIVNF
ncbi:hypothetical protein [Pseudalkalibacillus berkeleyi]|uniref:Uncharacterized protein n=1 Tax=Pseudalkalibacillus berkeleyi TaxID=1069813 RepID=A0ABS9H5H5_9BACL|nr:hypothetical protein [Pseudalkalibacillus berkeleyi]MCF6139366.1 hypothetical protein [Pseudalkalibacillus berkeleyi]